MKVFIGSTVKGSNQNLGKKKSRKPKSKGLKSRRRRKSRRQEDTDFSESNILKMESIWLKTCSDLKISEDIASKWFQIIRENLSKGEADGRFYHNWSELLLRKKEFLSGASYSVVLAVFFQYCKFDAKKNCVEENCDIFRQFCKDASFNDESIIRKVTKMLGEASIEEPLEFEADANIFQDLDLLVLGSPPEEYKTYTELLRKEYSHLDDANYKKMRLKILQTFLTIPTIYLTSEFQNRYEEAARTNINKEVEELKK